MVRRKNFGRGIYIQMLVEEPTNIVGKLPVFGSPSGFQSGGSLFIGTAYRLPAERAGGDERRQLILAVSDGNSLFVCAPVSLSHLATTLRPEACAQFDQRHA